MPKHTSKRVRLDQALVANGMVDSRRRAQALIMAGLVTVNGQKTDKTGKWVAPHDEIALHGNDHPYVSRGGLKLEHALVNFALKPQGWICLDVGASTGGFTDCLLQFNAKRVYAVDVGYGQLAWKLRQDERVVVIERTNIRYLQADLIPDPIDLIAIDASFISLKLILPCVLPFLAPNGHIVTLIKPQFEVGKGQVGKGGVVRDPLQHEAVKADIARYCRQIALEPKDIIQSPILGPKGNREFLIHCRRRQTVL